MALHFVEAMPGVQIYGLDNLTRRGAETSLEPLKRAGVTVLRGDVRMMSDFSPLPDVDWVIDCAANPSVMAGLTTKRGNASRQLMQHNLLGSLNTLEYCRERQAGFVLLSSSRVYSIPALRRIALRETESRFVPVISESHIEGFSSYGIAEEFPTTAPLSLYGATKLASETLALEYGHAFGFPVWINRCGVIGGPGQFGKIDQGILAFWVYSFLLERPLRYISFGGTGKQVRDFVSAEDVADLVLRQLQDPGRAVRNVLNVGGGPEGALSLRELTDICRDYFGSKEWTASPMSVESSDEERPYDIPYYVTDIRRVRKHWQWQPSLGGEALALKLCNWAVAHRDFVERLMS
jgi:CDP-paratose 2-epimerase